MKNRKTRGRRGRRNESRLRRIRLRYMRRRRRKKARARRLAFLFCAVLAAGYLLVLASQAGRLFEIEDTRRGPEKRPQEQLFGIIFRLKDGEITLYQESSY